MCLESADGTVLEATKAFQPDDDEHAVLEMHLICQPHGKGAVLFANAVQTNYELKKNRQKMGLSASSLGSISLPWGATADSLVKVGCETIDSKKFYERFFSLVDINIKRLGGAGKQP